MSQGGESFLSSVERTYDQAAELVGITPGLRHKIKVANSTYTVRFGVRLRDRLYTFTGYRSVHSEHMEHRPKFGASHKIFNKSPE